MIPDSDPSYIGNNFRKREEEKKDLKNRPGSNKKKNFDKRGVNFFKVSLDFLDRIL